MVAYCESNSVQNLLKGIKLDANLIKAYLY